MLQDQHRKPYFLAAHRSKKDNIFSALRSLDRFFLLLCCAHHDDGDSLGMNDDLVHQMQKRGIPVTQQKPTKTAPHNNTHKPTKQNPGSPTMGETVKQIALSE